MMWPVVPIGFSVFVLYGYLRWAAIFNKCHLTVWLLIFEAVRNLVMVEQHATLSWWHSTLNKVFKLTQ